MLRRLLLFAFLLLAVSSIAQAGIVRHVIKPAVKTGAKVTAKVAKTTVHVVKTVAY